MTRVLFDNLLLLLGVDLLTSDFSFILGEVFLLDVFLDVPFLEVPFFYVFFNVLEDWEKDFYGVLVID